MPTPELIFLCSLGALAAPWLVGVLSWLFILGIGFAKYMITEAIELL